MRQDRSDRSPLPLPLLSALVVVAAGIGSMTLAAWAFGPRLGLRPTLVLTELALATPGLIAVAAAAGSLKAPLGLRPLDRRGTLVAVAAGVTLWAASLGLLETQYVWWRPPDGYLDAFRRLHEALRPSGPVDALASVATIAIAPAVCEELLFRGVVLPALATGAGRAVAVVGSALLFGIIHLDATAAGSHSLYRVPFAFAVGLGLGVLRLRTGSLLPPMIAHATLNTITFLAAPLADDASSVPEPRPWLGGGLLLAGSLLSALTLKQAREDRPLPS